MANKNAAHTQTLEREEENDSRRNKNYEKLIPFNAFKIHKDATENRVYTLTTI